MPSPGAIGKPAALHRGSDAVHFRAPLLQPVSRPALAWMLVAHPGSESTPSRSAPPLSYALSKFTPTKTIVCLSSVMLNIWLPCSVLFPPPCLRRVPVFRFFPSSPLLFVHSLLTSHSLPDNPEFAIILPSLPSAPARLARGS